MATAIDRRAASVLAALVACVLIAVVAAPHADAATIYACVKKSGSARLVSQKAKCKKKESKISWGTEGPAGPAGKNGANGTNGANGVNGKDGQNLTTQTPLASGQSESGFYATGSGSSTTGYTAEGITFAQPLAAALPAGRVVYNTAGTTSTHCPGFGHADPGYACMYELEASNLTFLLTRDFAFNENAADKYGFAVFFEVKTGGGYIAGSWTVTAP
jgi:hypothetical protein